MTPITSLLLPIGISAVVVFVLTMILHMTPWHKRDYVKLPDEDDVMKSLRPFNIPPNDYVVPHPGSGKDMASPEYDAKRNAGPVMWITVLPTGPWNIGKIMGLWFVFVVIVTTSVAWIMTAVAPPGADAHGVFHCVAMISFLAYAMGAFPMSIWHDRKWSTTIKNTVDSLLYALATGWIFSMMWPKV